MSDVTATPPRKIKERPRQMLRPAELWVPPSPANGLAAPEQLPLFPIYIPTKGRANASLTARELSKYRVPFTLVVERHEVEAYTATAKALGGYGRVLELDPQFQRDYEACIDLPDDASRGSGPARNFAWEHAKADGHPYYWCIDDNIQSFFYYMQNRKRFAGDAGPLIHVEEYARRYRNVAMAGPHYAMFLPRLRDAPPYVLNTRVYSCNLIRTDLKQRWRGRYNEDTILSLDILKAGWNTLLFYAYLAGKVGTMGMKGGNTDTIYAEGSAHFKKAELLRRVHPDVTSIVERFNRVHHYVDYTPFQSRKLVLFDDAKPFEPRPLEIRERAPQTPLRKLLREGGALQAPTTDQEDSDD